MFDFYYSVLVYYSLGNFCLRTIILAQNFSWPMKYLPSIFFKKQQIYNKQRTYNEQVIIATIQDLYNKAILKW